MTDAAVFRKRGSVEDRLASVSNPSSLRIDDVFLYWIDGATRAVHRLRRNAPPGATPAVVTTLPASVSTAHLALSARGGYLYFQAVLTAGSAVNTGVQRVHRCGGAPLTISPLFSGPNTLRVDDTHVYYGNGTTVRRVVR
jgi:hypothetical protein